MAVSLLSFSFATLANKLNLSIKPSTIKCSWPTIIASTKDSSLDEERLENCKRRSLLIGVGASSLLRTLIHVDLNSKTGRYYTLIVGENERRWRRVRNQLKVVADSFRVLDI